ncbi:hypothetical protein KP005_03075 [Geomonas nitrogeniifigens]|uniref:Chromosome segregation ATPase n=1 Tax=Geomonas diazotrophica TaxID=2843197 RepID=A0ABX8JIR5_9BACT|nr:hypothetical protein [Geomonas nitrogeniifigens]QWV98284.1 hypothetical protein KP005_03075 [Geomonas nitrogeniifigens]
MLALDSTIGCIEVSESEVVDIYRSSPITRSSDKRPETMEAYLCAIRRKTLVKVYLSLVVNDHRIYVYTTPGKGRSEQEYPREVEKALSYARAMGFAPERVDLSYSPAMREVVVRNTKVLRLPGTKGTGNLKHGLAGAPVLPILHKSEFEAPEAPAAIPSPVAVPVPIPVPVPVSAIDPSTPPAAAPSKAPTDAPVGSPAAARAAEGTETAELGIALARLQHEQRTLATERDVLTKQLQQLAAQQSEAANQLAAARKSLEELAGERDALLSRQRQADELMAAKDTEISELQKQADGFTLELETAANRNAEISRERDAMVENLAQARQDIAKLCAERDAALAGVGSVTQQHREAATQLDETRQELGRTSDEAARALQQIEALEASVRKQEGELASLRKELAGVMSERDAALQRLASEDGSKGSAEADLERLRQELERVGDERDAALARLAASEELQRSAADGESARLRQELERMGAERDAALQRVAVLEEGQVAARVEKSGHEPEWMRARQSPPEPMEEITSAPPPGRGDEPARPRQGEELFTGRILPGLQDALEPLPAFTESTLPPFADLQAPPLLGHPWDTAADADEIPAATETAGDFSFGGQETSFVPLGELQDGFFSAGDDAAPVRFLLETGLDAIECPAAENVLELHQSINNAYLSPEGTGGQESCQGYICCLSKGEGKRVFAAIYGTKSHRTRVYLPESQPQDDDSYARTVRGAISFAEEVGLMMERVPLEATGPKRRDRLKRCPALRLAETK